MSTITLYAFVIFTYMQGQQVFASLSQPCSRCFPIPSYALHTPNTQKSPPEKCCNNPFSLSMLVFLQRRISGAPIEPRYSKQSAAPTSLERSATAAEI